ncbi:HAD-IIB family hydrolase [Bifidobacterium canis]|uniref:phosphomannomutase n=1 Tax=Bifidobacterium canis TaxID=2610880 RepID=A0A7K1J3B5_9BIFI|nr:HAD-IIB family hydrolase [Bifidobacterium canis]MUH59009.1 HAD family hydrolase [Bifidobacterium canis]
MSEHVKIVMADQVDIAQLCARMKVMAFDLDGTLARSKKPMHEPMAQALSALTRLLPVAIISGGTIDLVRSQVTDMLTADANRANMHLMPTSGTRYYNWNSADGMWQEIYEHNLSETDRATVIASLEKHARELGIWESKTWGPRIEDRGSQITFSALGQQAPVEAKEQWDPDNVKKNKLAEAVQRDVPHLEVRSGGSTSVDISNKGVDKAYAVKELASMLGVEVSQIAFVGDRMDPDGNDYPAARAGTFAIRVTGPQDTLVLCERIIEWYGAHMQ